MNDRTSQDWIDQAERVSKWLQTATPDQMHTMAVKMAEAGLVPVTLNEEERAEAERKLIELGAFTQEEADQVKAEGATDEK
ncbi:hypothetical protein [Curtobacterium flaccumfaciens]|uniref:hypothetical protein n=1 Tax=Curtobacterium flaccumfaciens TaxID=2035 RepID=UPI001BE0AA77|nr:hypothetical protein [Curtobacterium flaccumfaciens]MBT1586152.1 hypothetical protein [Curtobacterium flaccumfaciens pv. flaccumfaciens]